MKYLYQYLYQIPLPLPLPTGRGITGGGEGFGVSLKPLNLRVFAGVCDFSHVPLPHGLIRGWQSCLPCTLHVETLGAQWSPCSSQSFECLSLVSNGSKAFEFVIFLISFL